MSISASPSPVPYNQSSVTVVGTTGQIYGYLRITRDGVQIAADVGRDSLTASDSISTPGQSVTYAFQYGPDEYSLTTDSTVTVRRGANKAATAAAAGVAALAPRLNAAWRLRASPTGTATVTAPALCRARPLAAAAAGVAALAPRLNAAWRLRASPTGTATVTAPFPTRARRLTAAAAGVATLAPRLSAAWQLAAALAGAATVTVTAPRRARPLAAAAAGAATLPSSLVRRARPLTVLSAGAATTTAPMLLKLQQLGGAVAGATSVTSVLLRRARPLAATVGGTGGLAALVGRARPLTATVGGTGGLTAVLRAAWALRSTLAGTASLTQPLLRRGRPIAGQSAAAATLTALVDRDRGLSATVPGVATAVAAALRRWRGLVGASQGAALPAGALRAAWALRGASTGQASVLLRTRRLFHSLLQLWKRAMGLEQLGSDISFSVYYTSNGLPMTGLADVKVDVFAPDGTKLVNQAGATEIGGSGCYRYTLTGPNVTQEGEYHAVFTTGNGNADSRSLPDRFTVGRAGIENLNATVGSRLAATAYTAPPSAASIASQLLTSGTAGYGTGTAGNALHQINAGPGVTVVSPVARDGYIELVAGDDYLTADGRQLRFINNAGTWPSLAGATVTFLSAYAVKERTGIRLDKTMSVVVASGANQEVKLDLTHTETGSLATGQNAYDWLIRAVLADASVVTLATGKLTVLPVP